MWYLAENLRPVKVVKALQYLLKNSEIFQKENIHVDDFWLKKITTSAESETCYEDNDFLWYSSN